MSVARICVRTVDVAHPNESIQVVACRMNARNVGMLVVVDDREKPIGIITDRDLTVTVLAQGKDPFQTVVEDVMTLSPVTVTEDAPLEDALRIMRTGSCRRLPVVNQAGKLVGILSVDDILAALADEFAQIRGLLESENPQALGRA